MPKSKSKSKSKSKCDCYKYDPETMEGLWPALSRYVDSPRRIWSPDGHDVRLSDLFRVNGKGSIRAKVLCPIHSASIPKRGEYNPEAFECGCGEAIVSFDCRVLDSWQIPVIFDSEGEDTIRVDVTFCVECPKHLRDDLRFKPLPLPRPAKRVAGKGRKAKGWRGVREIPGRSDELEYMGWTRAEKDWDALERLYSREEMHQSGYDERSDTWDDEEDRKRYMY